MHQLPHPSAIPLDIFGPQPANALTFELAAKGIIQEDDGECILQK